MVGQTALTPGTAAAKTAVPEQRAPQQNYTPDNQENDFRRTVCGSMADP